VGTSEAADSPTPSAIGTPNPEGETPEGEPFDPFSRHLDFAGWVRTGKLSGTLQQFLDALREPIDVRADKVLDLSRFGKGPALFLKTPRLKRSDEFPEGYEERLKNDLERQFILRNLMRFVKTVNKDDPLEFERKPAGVKPELGAHAHLQHLHRKAELISELGVQHMKHELAWRHRFLAVMQWERYYCREIKDEFDGPMWKHDPETNPVRPKANDEAHGQPAGPPLDAAARAGAEGEE